MTAVYLATAALLVLSVAAVRYQRLSISVPAIILALAAAGWNVTRFFRGPVDPDPSLLIAINMVFVQICAAAFYVTCQRLVTGRWFIRAWHWIIAVTISTLSFIGLLPNIGITDGEVYRESPVYIAALIYSVALVGAGVIILSERQHDPSRHVRRFVLTSETLVLLLLTAQVAVPSLAPILAAGLSLLVTWSTGRTVEWSRSASRAHQLLDSIGVFIFVIDRAGILHDWNGPAASLVEMRGETATRGMDLGQALGRSEPFVDGTDVNLEIRDGVLRTSVSVHEVDPLSRDSDRVLMFSPVRSTVETSSFPQVSGALRGHDPATQTLGRKAALDQLRQAVGEGTRILRIEIRPKPAGRADELMFTLARRIESRGAEENWAPLEWARLDEWSFVAAVTDPNTAPLPFTITVEDLGIDLSVTSHRPFVGEMPTDFIQRVASGEHRDGHTSAHGS